jgi:shikimate dehydrogenase
MRVGDALPLDTDQLSSSMIVCEVVMEPEETALLAAAQRAGCRIHLGKPMLTHQAELMADFFRVPAGGQAKS